MTEEQEERLVMAMEMMAAALSSIGRTYELQYYKTFPPRRAPRDIHISRQPSAEEKLREDQGATGETTTEDWMTLDGEEEVGPYTRKFDEEKRRRGDAGGSEDRSREPGRRSQETGT